MGLVPEQRPEKGPRESGAPLPQLVREHPQVSSAHATANARDESVHRALRRDWISHVHETMATAERTLSSMRHRPAKGCRSEFPGQVYRGAQTICGRGGNGPSLSGSLRTRPRDYPSEPLTTRGPLNGYHCVRAARGLEGRGAGRARSGTGCLADWLSELGRRWPQPSIGRLDRDECFLGLKQLIHLGLDLQRHARQAGQDVER